MKDKKMSIRISEDDLKTIHLKARKSLLTLTEYVTTCCLGKQIVVIDGLHEVVRLQKNHRSKHKSADNPCQHGSCSCGEFAGADGAAHPHEQSAVGNPEAKAVG